MLMSRSFRQWWDEGATFEEIRDRWNKETGSDVTTVEVRDVLVNNFPDVREERDKRIADMWRQNDLTYQEIGEKFGITREAVRLIIKKQLSLDEYRRYRQERAADKRARIVYEFVQTKSVRDTAHNLGLSPQRVRAHLTEAGFRVAKTRVKRTRPFKWENSVALGKELYERWGALTAFMWRQETEGNSDVCSVESITARWGSWGRFQEACGVPKSNTSRPELFKWSEDELRAMVAEYLASSSGAPSAAGFTRWSRARGGPTAATVARHLGPLPDVFIDLQVEARQCF